jgi:hypothetical protein
VWCERYKNEKLFERGTKRTCTNLDVVYMVWIRVLTKHLRSKSPISNCLRAIAAAHPSPARATAARGIARLQVSDVDELLIQ